MTPEERARADAITEEIARQSKARRNGTPAPIPRISPEAPAATGHGIRYALIFTSLALAHVAGFLAYQNHTQKKEEQRRREIAEAHAQAEAEKRTAAEAETEKLRLSLAKQSASPKIEYKVISQPPAPRPQTPNPRVTPPQLPAPAPVITKDRTEEHAAIALSYLRSKKSDTWRARATSTEQVSGWEGRYRTEFEIPRDSYTGNSSPTPRRFDVLTLERDGKITGIDVTTKGY